MIVVKRGKEPNSLLEFRKNNPDADYEDMMLESRCGMNKSIFAHIV